EIAVDLDYLEALHPLEQGGGERAQARADLDQAIVGARIDARDDAAHDRGIHQEVLAEALARAVRREYGHADSRWLSLRARGFPTSAEPRKSSEASARGLDALRRKPPRPPHAPGIARHGGSSLDGLDQSAGVGSLGARDV